MAVPQLVVEASGSIGGSSCLIARQPPSMSPLTAAPAAIAEPAPRSIHVVRCFRRLFTLESSHRLVDTWASVVPTLAGQGESLALPGSAGGPE
jgi:hypothetical protein